MNPSQMKRGGGCCLSSETWDPAFSGMAVFVVGGAPLNDWPGGLGRGPDHRLQRNWTTPPDPVHLPCRGSGAWPLLCGNALCTLHLTFQLQPARDRQTSPQWPQWLYLHHLLLKLLLYPPEEEVGVTKGTGNLPSHLLGVRGVALPWPLDIWTTWLIVDAGILGNCLRVKS